MINNRSFLIYSRQNFCRDFLIYIFWGSFQINLNFEYNLLHLLHNVREGGTIIAGYEYGYGGVKLKVWDSDGNGYAYMGNLVYRVTGSSFVFESGLFGEGVVSGSSICYHLKDHLGSIRAIVDGSGRLLEENDYYAFGHRHPRSEHAQSSANRFKYNGKELQTVGGLGYLDYGARLYDQSLGRWFTTDPLSEKYYGLSPYVYCGNNPIRYVDPTGLSHSEFDENGNYLRTTKDNWFHNTFFGRTGRIVDGDGNVTQKFKFADPKNDVQDLKDGKINRVQFVQESEIISMLSWAGAFNSENKTANSDSRYGYISEEGKGEGRFDFAVTGIPSNYSDYNQSLFLVDGVAHNRYNYGNFLFGAAGRALGLTSFELRMGAHYNSVFNPSTNGYKPQLDSQDDQFSIRMGVRHANKHGYKDMYYRVTVGPLSRP